MSHRVLIGVTLSKNKTYFHTKIHPVSNKLRSLYRRFHNRSTLIRKKRKMNVNPHLKIRKKP